MLALVDGRQSRPVSRRKPPSGSRSIKNILDPDGKGRRWRKRHETCACRRHIVPLPPSASSLHVLPISRMSVYIFLTTFFSNPTVGSPFSLSFVIFLSELTCLSKFFIVSLSFFLSLSLFPSFPELPGNVCAFHPEKWIFLFGKKSEKSAYSLHTARGSLLARVQTKRFQTYERRPWARIERKDVERGRKRIESKTAMVAKGKMKTTHLRTRSEREGEIRGGTREARCLSRKVEIWRRQRAKEKGRESEAHPYYMRVPHERRAKSTSNPLTEVNRKKPCVIYRVTLPI